MRTHTRILALLALAGACSGTSAARDAGVADGGGRKDASSGGSNPEGGKGGTAAGGSGAANASGWWRPDLGSSWQIQYADTLDTSVDVQVYDIDLVDNSAEKIAALQAKGRKVICYFDTAYEDWRPDAKALEPYKGKPLDDWPGQSWVDIRQAGVMDVMLKRLDLAKTKHCDGVDPDDVDAYANDSGFPLTAQDQQTFITKIVEAAHARGLAVGLKNDLDQIPQLVDSVDFAVNEQCFEMSECEQVMPFIRANKPVFNVEYTDGDMPTKGADVCPDSTRRMFSTLIKRLNLNAERYACK